MARPWGAAGRVRGAIGAGIALIVTCGFAGGCSDDEATDREVVGCFDSDGGSKPIEILAATPFRTVDGQRIPVCGGAEAAEGIFVSFNLKTFLRRGPLEGNNDLQTREGELVCEGDVTTGPDGTISPSIFAFDLSCLESYPDKTDACEADDGVAGAQATITDVSFVARSTGRSQPVSVAILVDHSESMIGFGNQDRKEVREGFVEPGTLSDPTHARYRAAIDGVIRNLNDEDRLIAWYFNEDGVSLACSAPGIDQIPADEQEQSCFGTQHDWVGGAIDPTDPFKSIDGAFTDLGKGKILAKGRTPLWAAVDHAWDFLQEHAPAGDGPTPRHIVVITDSPDTCDPTSPHWLPGEPCATHVPYETLRKKIDDTPLADRIPVSIVQFQSHGYPQQDGAQMEIACMTGGTYRWINRLDFSDGTADFETSLESILQRIRYTFGGVWRLAIDVPALADAGGPGRVLALDGSLTLVPPNIINPLKLSQTFRLSPPEDNRLLIRRGCTAEADCPGGSDADCFTTCNPHGGLCAWPATNALGQSLPGIPIGEGGTVSLEGGGEGTCCCGVPQVSGAKCGVSAAPCCDPSVDTTCQ